MVIYATEHTPNRITILGHIVEMTANRANQGLAANIRRLMEEHPILSTQAALARKSGLAQSSIQRVLNAAVHPQLDVIEAIADAFRVTPAQLLTPEVDVKAIQPPEQAAGFGELSDTEREKVATYIRFLAFERTKEAGQGGKEEFIRLAELRELSVDQLAEVMRPTHREPNNNMHTNHAEAHSETKRNRSRSGH